MIMATEESKRVTTHRKYNCDRITTLIDKGGKYLLHAQAIREGVTVAEMIRRSILARAGLRMLPYKPDLDALAEVSNQEEAEQAILRLQAKEEKDEIIKKVLHELAPEPDAALYSMKVDHDTRCALLRLAGLSDPEISDLLRDRWGADEEITGTGFDVGHIRRLLANMKTLHIGEENTR